MTLTTISAEEIARHCDASSLWISVDGTVYDLTSFLDAHPGGPSALLDRNIGASSAMRA